MRDPGATYRFEPTKSNTPTSWRKVGFALRGKDERRARRGRGHARQRDDPTLAPERGSRRPHLPRLPLPGPSCAQRRQRPRSNGRRNGNGKAASLAEHMLTSTPTELFEAARVFGVDQVWDLMIMPVMQATDRQSKAAK